MATYTENPTTEQMIDHLEAHGLVEAEFTDGWGESMVTQANIAGLAPNIRWDGYRLVHRLGVETW